MYPVELLPREQTLNKILSSRSPLIGQPHLTLFQLDSWKPYNVISDLAPIIGKQGLQNPQKVSFESHGHALTSTFTACALNHCSFHKIVRKIDNHLH